MSRYTLEHCYDVVFNNKDAVAEFLRSLAECDNDFNGNNGYEYLWDRAEGFESNAEYCLSIVGKEATPGEMVEKFISMWMDEDSYYFSYDLGIHVEDDKLFVSLAYLTAN